MNDDSNSALRSFLSRGWKVRVLTFVFYVVVSYAGLWYLGVGGSDAIPSDGVERWLGTAMLSVILFLVSDLRRYQLAKGEDQVVEARKRQLEKNNRPKRK